MPEALWGEGVRAAPLGEEAQEDCSRQLDTVQSSSARCCPLVVVPWGATRCEDQSGSGLQCL
eukprot:2407508-Alexandrium_andersonii.AAC.1